MNRPIEKRKYSIQHLNDPDLLIDIGLYQTHRQLRCQNMCYDEKAIVDDLLDRPYFHVLVSDNHNALPQKKKHHLHKPICETQDVP